MKTFVLLLSLILCTNCRTIGMGLSAIAMGAGGQNLAETRKTQTETQRIEAERELYGALTEQTRLQNELLKQAVESSDREPEE